MRSDKACERDDQESRQAAPLLDDLPPATIPPWNEERQSREQERERQLVNEALRLIADGHSEVIVTKRVRSRPPIHVVPINDTGRKNTGRGAVVVYPDGRAGIYRSVQRMMAENGGSLYLAIVSGRIVQI